MGKRRPKRNPKRAKPRTPSAIAPIDYLDPSPQLDAPPRDISRDEKYLRHQFVTYAGGQHWSAGWTPEEMREALRLHLAGWLYQSAVVARDVVREPSIFGALKQREAPTLRTTWSIDGPSRAPGRYVVDDLDRVWQTQIRPGLRETIRDVAMLGGSIGHVHWVYDVERGVEMPVVKRWPHEAIVWRAESPGWPMGFYAVTLDSGLVRIVPGDGKWCVFGNGNRWHEMGAVMALGMGYVGATLARRDRAGLSEASGRAAPVAFLPEGVDLADKEAEAMARTVAGLGRARRGAVFPAGAKLEDFHITSETSFFKDYAADTLLDVSLVLLGQAGTLVPGAGGVYTAPVFQGVAMSLIDADHEAVERGWSEGIEAPFHEINATGIATRLVAERYSDDDTKAEAHAKRAGLLAATVKAQRDAGLMPSQEDVNALAAALNTAPVALAAAPQSPAITPPAGGQAGSVD